MPALLALESQAFPTDRLSKRSFGRFVRMGAIWVIDREVRLVGYVCVLLRRLSRAARIYSLAVDAAHRRMGVGRSLLCVAERHAAAQGCVAMRLEVRSADMGAMRFYREAGYTVSTGLPGYYADGADGLRLVKTFALLDAEPGHATR